MNYLKKLILICLMMSLGSHVSYSQIVAPTGISTRATSQLIYFYNLDEFTESFIQVTNTNDTEGVWIHVQIFRNHNDDANEPDLIECDERDFVDFLTPNDTHVYDLENDLFPKNTGETATTPGDLTTIDLTDPVGTAGFILITPVVSESDFSSISFQHLIGTSSSDDLTDDFKFNAMGRDAVDFVSGEVLADGTVLDGVTGGFTVLQPEELFFDFIEGSTDEVDIIGIAFKDNYGPAGLLGYNVEPATATWSTFVFDYRENPTSCGAFGVNCFISIGLNDSLVEDSDIVSAGAPNDEFVLCAGAETPDHPTFNGGDFFGWTRMFVSGLADFVNHIGILITPVNSGGADYINVRGERTDVSPSENCGIAGDEDGDLAADCADTDCVGQAGPNGETCEIPEATCDDAADNDGDGNTDCADTDCDAVAGVGCEGDNPADCSDGADSDGDGNTDCADGGCDGQAGPNGETCETGAESTCNDGADNDADGASDCDDSDCAAAENCAGDGGGGGGCSVASSSHTSLLSLLLPLIVVGIAIGVRRRR